MATQHPRKTQSTAQDRLQVSVESVSAADAQERLHRVYSLILSRAAAQVEEDADVGEKVDRLEKEEQE